MKIFLSKTQCVVFTLILLFSRAALAEHVVSKSFLASIATPTVGLIYSYSISDYEGIKELAYSCAFTAQLTTLLKNTVRRTRPNGEDDLSFPSGHASGSFTGASYLHHRYGLKWGIPMYAIAAAISVQRTNVDQHYWTDIIAGGALGYLSGYLFSERYPKIWVAPSFSPSEKSYGLSLKYNLG